MSIRPELSQHHQSIAYVAKLLMLGQSCVGKTSIVKRCAEDIFPQSNTLLTVGVDIRKINKTITNKNICLQLWDTAGQQKFKTLPTMYFKNVQGIILVYDLTDSISFQKIQSWIQKIDENCRLQNLALMLVGNKLDLQQRRQVSIDQGLTFATKKSMKFKQTSAKSGKNIDQMINQIMATVIDKKLLVQRRTQKQISLNQSSNTNEKQSCC